jgi:hypothetical protein
MWRCQELAPWIDPRILGGLNPVEWIISSVAAYYCTIPIPLDVDVGGSKIMYGDAHLKNIY